MHSTMWYHTPASEWKEGLPIGNGMLAGMIIGGTPTERVALNHERLWRANGRFRDTPPRHQHLQEIRDLFFQGKMLEAGELANERLGGPGGVLSGQGTPNRVDPYQPAGDLLLEYEHDGVSEYTRRLDLSTGIAIVRYEAGGREYERRIFAHADLPILCIRLTCSEPSGLNVRARLSRIEDPECTLTPSADENGFGLRGALPEGPQFLIATRVLSSDGEIVPDPEAGGVNLQNATEAILALTIAVTHDGEDPGPLADEQLSGVPADWASLRTRHAEVFGSLYDRVSLILEDTPDERPTDERLAALRNGAEDKGLMALYFNFGRYLLISSSRPGGLPANLQGVWNEDLDPPWQCDLHHDVNIQMNYWPAEVCGLSECIGPLFDHIHRFVPHGREMAKALYNCDGIFLPIQTDPWGRATPESRGWDVWTGAAAWLAQHLWWRYEYSLDEGFLRESAYPIFKEVAAFYRSYLVRDDQGRLVTVPSQSPENRFVGGCSPVSLCIAAAMDLELIHDVLTHAIRASEILNVDEDLRGTWRTILKQIVPLQIGRHGQLQEWLEDYEEQEPQHRHISHLFGLFPGDQLTLEGTPELTQAARVSLERRLASGGGHTGWSRAWTVCCWARLREGDLAYEHLRALIADFATDSLLDLHPPRIFQIDGNLGGTAGIAEMLLQSHRNILRILPALPCAWPSGRVTGLRGRGGFVVEIEWKEDGARTVHILSTLGGPCTVQITSDRPPTVRSDGAEVEYACPAEDQMVFDTTEGEMYTLSW